MYTILGGDTETQIIFETRAGTNWRKGSIGDWLEFATELATDGLVTVNDQSDFDATLLDPIG